MFDLFRLFISSLYLSRQYVWLYYAHSCSGGNVFIVMTFSLTMLSLRSSVSSSPFAAEFVAVIVFHHVLVFGRGHQPFGAARAVGTHHRLSAEPLPVLLNFFYSEQHFPNFFFLATSAVAGTVFAVLPFAVCPLSFVCGVHSFCSFPSFISSCRFSIFSPMHVPVNRSARRAFLEQFIVFNLLDSLSAEPIQFFMQFFNTFFVWLCLCA